MAWQASRTGGVLKASRAANTGLTAHARCNMWFQPKGPTASVQEMLKELKENVYYEKTSIWISFLNMHGFLHILATK